MLKYYAPCDISSLELSPRNKFLRDELLEAPKTYSSVNAEISERSYRQTADLPVALRRARALAALFTRMPIYIRERELLVGNRSESLGVFPILQGENPSGDSNRGVTRPVHYEGVGIEKNYQARLDDRAKAAEECFFVGHSPTSRDTGFGHILADYWIIAEKGALALAEEAEEQALFFKAENKSRQEDFCRASAVACRGFAALGARYSELARNQAANCKDEVRRKELLEIAEVCSQVPSLPARSFREALQAVFFTHQAMLIEQSCGSISIGGFDRRLYPYYLKDMESGILNSDLAAELVDSFYIKLMENAIWPREIINFCNMAIGGCGADGEDLSNDLTWMALDASMKTGSTHPLLSFRWHPGMDKALWRRVIQSIGQGRGLPAVFSDPRMIESIESLGIDRQTAADYGVVGCVEPGILGILHGQTLGGHLNLLMCLELALNDGRRIGHTERLGVAAGKLTDFNSMEDIWKAYHAQVEYACQINRDCVFRAAEAQRECFAYPLMSSIMRGAIEDGRDLTYGAVYNHPSVDCIGGTNVVDSLLAIEDLVFKKKRYTTADFYKALFSNFEGYEKLRAEIMSSQARFGNGDSYFVEVYDRVCKIHASILKSMLGPRGDYFIPALWPVHWHVRQGACTAASPDGRMAGMPLADGAGPVSSRTANSPTGIIRDMAGIDSVCDWPGGYVFNMMLPGSLFSDDLQTAKVADFIDSFFRMGGMQIQVNTVSRETLIAAQKSPEEHKDLVVRVAGFSAYFTALSEASQNEIIAREQVTV